MPRIAEVALFTEDVARLTAFYENLLGRPPDNRSGAPDGRAVELQDES